MHRLSGLAEKPPRHYAKGEWIVRWGEACTGAYLIERGTVKLAYHAPCGAEKVFAIVRPGESFGEATLLAGGRWLVSARALTDCTLLHVPARRLAEELARDPALAGELLAQLSQRLARLLSETAALGGRSSTERLVAYLLADAGDGARGPVELALARKADVASRLGMSPEHLSRVLGRLESAGFIEVHGRRVRVSDPARLARGADLTRIKPPH